MTSKPDYNKVIKKLRRSYDLMTYERDKKPIEKWKLSERQLFVEMLVKEDKRTLLEIGAGTGIHGKFFQEHGIQVICTDLSKEMVNLCRKKGLTAYEMDFLNMDFPSNSFEAVFALNCLLHVPKNDFKSVLKEIHRILKPFGLFYLGQYGGKESEGIFEEDTYEPKRFFSILSDHRIKKYVRSYFKLKNFKRISLKDENDFHFQSILLQKDNPDHKLQDIH